MKEVWDEIWQSADAKRFLVTLLSIALLVLGVICLIYAFSLREEQRIQHVSSIGHLITNPLQTNFTS